jgi:hypothetical protein
MALILHKHVDGSVTVDSELPDSHEFTSRWIADAVERGLVSLTLTLNIADGPVEYDFTGFRMIKSGKGEKPDRTTLHFGRRK